MNFKAVDSGYLNGYLSGYLDGYLNDKKKEEELVVLELINKNPKITLNEIKDNMQIARSHVQRIMKRLADKGIIERVGSKKDGYWNIK